MTKNIIKYLLMLFIFLSLAIVAVSNSPFEKDTFQTTEGELEITFIGHGTLMFSFQDMVIHVDPYGRLADYTELPEADLVLLTHSHGDHLDMDTLNQVKKEGTSIIQTETCYETTQEGMIMKNGDEQTVKGITIEAVPAYNIEHMRSSGEPYHPKGFGNGYILQLGDLRVYIGGDTENIPEMQEFGDIDIAFIPMNLPYTMSPEMAADAAKMIQPDILYPYHYGDSDVNHLIELLEDEDMEIRIREMA